MSINLLRFVNNPIKSLKKSYSHVEKFFFSRDVNRVLSNSKENPNKKIHLDSIFIDKRESHDDIIEKIRCISSNILAMIDYLAEHYQFNYFLAYGTLIGAIRHNDFIPWDDDIDIMMTKEDLKKLLSLYRLLPSYIEIKVMDNNFVKIMDKNSKISLDGKRGVAVDIFVLNTKGDQFCFKNVHNNNWINTPKKNWFPTLKHPFGKNKFSIPANYDSILTKIYGNYMKLPPIEKRKFPHIDLNKIKI